MENLIEVRDLSKTFQISKRGRGIPGMVANLFVPKYEKKTAVKNVSFTIKEGEMVGFIGPNGAGKSTTIKMLSGILYPDSGSLQVAGYIPYRQRREYVSQIGVVFGQKSQLQWDLPVIDSFELLKAIYRIPDEIYRKNLERYTEMLNMSGFLHQPVRQLSLGQRMRADIVAALLHSPRIVFFDEPTIGVDVSGKEVIRSFLRELNENDKLTMIFTTHDMQDIEKTCQRLLIIDDGRKVYDGSLEGIKAKYSAVRQLDVEFAESLTVRPIAHVTIQEIDTYKKRFLFENATVEIQDLMNHLLTKYPVRDLNITEPAIEGIIRRIYQGEEAIL
ncbi:MAG: ATP-binding cassette domain-containing protein [Candidatus Gastranaerophilales bacterium]|nr:ATP-binding cassette domain-containing protein [Candidatus Gastranaerophilales bacterium]